MMKYLKTLLIVLMGTFVASCCTKPTIISNGSDTTRNNTTIVKVTPKPIDVVVPKQDINATFNIIECDPVTNKPIPATSTIRNGNTSVTVKIDSTGRLDVNTTIDSLKLVVWGQDSIITHLNKELVTVRETAIVKAPIPTFYKICMWIAIAFVGMIAIKIIKIFRPSII